MTQEERAAWLKIREAFQRYAETGERCDLTFHGICHSVNALYLVGKISRETMFVIWRRMDKHRPQDSQFTIYWWGLGQSGALSRVKWIDDLLAKYPEQKETK
jgi:hypothetical protein